MPRPPSSPQSHRRAVLAGSLAALTSAPQAAGEPIASDLFELTQPGRQVRQLSNLLWTSIEQELSLEGTPTHEAACERADVLQEQFDALATRPASSWGDVVTCAEIAQAYSPSFTESLKDRALKELFEAVLAMGGRHV